MWLPRVSWKVKSEKMQISTTKLPIVISEKNETKVMHRIKVSLNPIYFANELGEPWILFTLEPFFAFK